MTKIVPTTKPRRPESEIRQMLSGAGVDMSVAKVAVIGIRGYYLDTMGRENANDRGIYDDAIFVLSDNVYAAYNANVDPSAFRKGVASLKPGVHWYRPGNHGISRPGGGYPAFRPANPQERLPVTRDGQTGDFWGIAINIHRGSHNSTSSLGCQTIHPSQWDGFQSLVMTELKRAGMKKFPYLLAVER